MSNMSKEFFCACRKVVDPNDPDTIKCDVCSTPMHRNCYTGNANDSEDIIDPLCFVCTVNKINPFETLDIELLNPIILPKNPDPKTGKITGSFHIREELKKQIDNGGNYRILLYSVFHESRFLNEKQIAWPNEFEIHFNNHKLKTREHEPVEITHFAKLNTNFLTFQYKQLQKNYVFFVISTRSTQIKELCDNLEKCLQKSRDQSKEKMCQLLKDLNIEKDKLDLKCSYSSSIMKTPVRGKDCKHINCFDLRNYITYAKSTKVWKCPICRNYAFYRDLYIDTYIKDLVESFEKIKKDFDELELVFDSRGNLTESKKLKKFAGDNTKYFDSDKLEKKTDQINYSPKKDVQDVEMDLDQGMERVRIGLNNYGDEMFNEVKKLFARMIADEEDFEEIIKSLHKQDLIKKFSLKQFIKFIDEFQMRPNRSRNIFPNKTMENATAMYYKKCEQIWEKFKNLNMMISIWCMDTTKLILLVKEFANLFNENNIEKLDHYFSIEILISFAYNIFKLDKENNNIEYLIGKLLGSYSKECYLNEIQVAHIIDQITILFPSFYLPKTDFSTEKDQRDYFERMVTFFCGILSEFSPQFNGKVMKKILTPIKTPISKLSEVELVFIKLIEELFLSSLFDKLEYTSNARGLFLKEYDTYGHLREFLRQNQKLFKYGYDYDENIISEGNNISDRFKLMETGPCNNPLQKLLK